MIFLFNNFHGINSKISVIRKQSEICARGRLFRFEGLFAVCMIMRVQSDITSLVNKN